LALYDVTAVALNPHTGSVVSGPRVERIDTDTNDLFATCTHEWDVKDTYEAFWNRLSDNWASDFAVGQMKVKVLAVRCVNRNHQAIRH
jgi:hypothetical protein